MRNRNGRVLRDRANIIRSVERLLAYGTMARCRRPHLRDGGNLALVLIFPSDVSVGDYRHAANFAFSKPNRPDGFDFGDNAKIVIGGDYWGKERKEPAQDDLLKHDCLVILANDLAEVPKAVMAAIDGVITQHRPQIHHFMGAGRICRCSARYHLDRATDRSCSTKTTTTAPQKSPTMPRNISP